MLMFIGLYRNVLWDDESLKVNGFDYGIRYPLVFEDEFSEKDIPVPVIKAFEKVINTIKYPG